MTELVIDRVGQRYERDRWALREVSLHLERGVVSLVGPNGAGKTTLLRMLATLLAPTEGRILWNGTNIARQPLPLRRTLGYLPQDFGVYPQLTARGFLRYIGELKGLPSKALGRHVDAALDAVRLAEDAHRRLRTFSGGMIRRVGIAQALLGDPQVLVLDEPTAGLDPAERARFRETLAALAGERLVVLSTHIVADVEAVATDLALLNQGQLTWVGTPAGLLADAEGTAWTLTVATEEFERLRATYPASAAIRLGERVEARLLARHQPHPAAVPTSPTLEEAYLLFASESARLRTGSPIEAEV